MPSFLSAVCVSYLGFSLFSNQTPHIFYVLEIYNIPYTGIFFNDMLRYSAIYVNVVIAMHSSSDPAIGIMSRALSRSLIRSSNI